MQPLQLVAAVPLGHDSTRTAGLYNSAIRKFRVRGEGVSKLNT